MCICMCIYMWCIYIYIALICCDILINSLHNCLCICRESYLILAYMSWEFFILKLVCILVLGVICCYFCELHNLMMTYHNYCSHVYYETYTVNKSILYFTYFHLCCIHVTSAMLLIQFSNVSIVSWNLHW